MEGHLERLDDQYAANQRRFAPVQGPNELAEAVTFMSNRERPVHRWFRFKEGFAANLLTVLGIDHAVLRDEDAVFVEPFCGCGTMLIAGDLEYGWRSRRFGFEVSPFLSFVASTKADWQTYDSSRVLARAEEVLAEPLEEKLDAATWPVLSTFHSEDMFESTRVSALLDAVCRMKAIGEPERNLLLLGVAAAAERVSYYRKDGRALRILRAPGELEERRNAHVGDVLREIWSSYAVDLCTLQERPYRGAGHCAVIQGDGRALQFPECHQVNQGSVALMVYSPPYLNHIGYTEVYKVELWLLQFVSSQRNMLALRKETVRSHGSVAVAKSTIALPPDVAPALETSVMAVTSSGSRWHRRFEALASAYLADLTYALQRQFALLLPGGRAVCVVANSAHGAKEHRVPIAVDLFLTAIAQSIGFEVERFVVARQVRRRDHLN